MNEATTHNRDAGTGVSSPGPPQRIIELRSWGTFLWGLVLLAACFASQAIVADYMSRTERPAAQRWWPVRYPWLDSWAAMTALVGMFGLAIARHNLALGLRPYLSYSNMMPSREDTLPTYLVLLRNEGTGPAVIAQMRYRLRFEGDDFDSLLEHETVVSRIKDRCGLTEGSDYKLDRFGVGATIGKDKERIVFEVKNETIDHLRPLQQFDIRVRYKGMLGDLYEKTVECLRPGGYRRPQSLLPLH